MNSDTASSHNFPTVSKSVQLPGGGDRQAESYDGNDAAPRILNSWKDIANYMGRGIRTVQRYESQFGLPVRRPAGRNRSSVVALSDEIDAWLNHAPTKDPETMKRVLLVLNPHTANASSGEKMVLEVTAVRRWTASTTEEVCAIAKRFGGDEVLIEARSGDSLSTAILESMKECKAKSVLFVSPQNAAEQGQATGRDDSAANDVESGRLLGTVKKLLAHARAA